MKALTNKANSAGMLFSVLALIAVVTILPHAFAITYTDADNPAGPLQSIGWTAGLAVAGVLSGVGVWTAIKGGKLH